VRGVYVEWERHALSGVGLEDNAVRLVVGNVVGATDRAKPGVWGRQLGSGSSALDKSVLYGGAADLWGEAGLTPAVVAAADFGAAMSVKYTSGAGNDHPRVDAVRMWVCYE
jgi:hypothetical protein